MAVGADTTADVLVLGSGPAGCSAAMTLHAAGFGVVLVDRPPRRRSPGEGLPSSALPVLERLGLRTCHHSAAAREWVGVISTWGAEAGERDFLFQPDGPGWHLDRAQFDAALGGAVRDRLGPDRWIAATHVTLARDGLWRAAWRRDEDGGVVRARALVDATGRARASVAVTGAAPTVVDQLVGWHGVVEVSRAPPQLTIIEAAPTGWWYGAPLPDGRAAVCFLTDPDLCSRRGLDALSRSPAALRVFERLGATPQAWAPEPHAAGFSLLSPAAGPGWIAVGDAALAHDPLSGQGIDFALRSGRRGTAAVAAELLGDPGPRQTYQAMVASRAEALLSARAQVYGQEGRWPLEAFWRRRQAPSSEPRRRHPRETDLAPAAAD